MEGKFERRIESYNDLEKYSSIIDKSNVPEHVEVARYEGTQLSRKNFDSGSRRDFEDAANWLSDYNPRTLGYLKGIKAYQEKAKGFRMIFGQ